MLSICVYTKNGKKYLINFVKQITSLNDNVVIDYGTASDWIFDKNNVATITAKVMEEVEHEQSNN